MKKTTFIAGILFTSLLLKAQTDILPDINLVPFSTGLSNPVGIEHAGDSRLFVVEQTGKIKIVDTNGKFKSHFLNLTDKVLSSGFEQGLLGLGFHPDYADNGYFYLHYTNLDGNSVISRFSVNPHNPNKALPSSEEIMLVNDDPFSNHNSGQITFGPDGYLYFTIGDGGAGGDPFNNAQDITTTFGKLMRINPTDDGGYTIPPDNPYAGVAGAAEEIWATGLRNPWRFSFDRLTGDIWLPDVGQNVWEEVNFQPASSAGGENYGWSCQEGTHFFKADCDDNGTPFTDPIAEYAHDNSPEFLCSGSITGGYIYRGSSYPDMYGKYIYTDFCTGVFRTTYWNGSEWVSAVLGNFTPFAYSTFGEDVTGELYVANKTNGTIYRVTDGGGVPLVHFPSTINPLAGGELISNLTFADQPEFDLDEKIIESVQRRPIVINKTELPADQFVLSPNPNDGQFTLHLEADKPELYSVSIRDIVGHKVLDDKKEMLKGINKWEFNSTHFSTGIYLLQVQTSEGISTLNFVVE